METQWSSEVANNVEGWVRKRPEQEHREQMGEGRCWLVEAYKMEEGL